MKDLKQVITNYSSRDLEQRKHWYSPAAEAYNKVRPRYPKELIRSNPQARKALFEGLRETIEQNYEGRIQLSYLSAFHIARKDR
jgi:hypothetical protein